MKKVFLIDNYDSFTYNLVQYVGHINKKLKVFKNNDYTIEEIVALNPKHIIISPGPGRPENSGVSIDVIKFFGVPALIITDIAFLTSSKVAMPVERMIGFLFLATSCRYGKFVISPDGILKYGISKFSSKNFMLSMSNAVHK